MSGDVEALAEAMHDAYETAAAEQGWATQERSRVAWADVPEANKATMRAMIRAVVPRDQAVRAEALAPIEALADEIERRITRAPDRVLQFWLKRLRAALAQPAADTTPDTP